VQIPFFQHKLQQVVEQVGKVEPLEQMAALVVVVAEFQQTALVQNMQAERARLIKDSKAEKVAEQQATALEQVAAERV
jgi:hypothetical protein